MVNTVKEGRTVSWPQSRTYLQEYWFLWKQLQNHREAESLLDQCEVSQSLRHGRLVKHVSYIINSKQKDWNSCC